MDLVARGGTAALSARAVAQEARVTPGLIRHHFGSMAGLLQACDEFTAEAIRQEKTEGVEAGLTFDVVSAIQRSGNSRLLGYLARRVGDDAPTINAMIDQIIDDAVGYLQLGVERGLFTPTKDPRARAAMLTLLSLGSLSMYRHLDRHFGVDLSDPNVARQPGYARYLLAMLDAMGHAVEPVALARYQEALEHLTTKEES